MLPTFSIRVRCRPFAATAGLGDSRTLRGRGLWRLTLFVKRYTLLRRGWSLRISPRCLFLGWRLADTARRVSILFGLPKLKLYAAVFEIATTFAVILFACPGNEYFLSLGLSASCYQDENGHKHQFAYDNPGPHWSSTSFP